MTSEREAFEKWARGEGYALAKQDDNSYHGIGIRNAWEGWKARAHLAQPAQAVDVGAIREVIADISQRKSIRSARRNTRLGWAETLTRALSGEKAGPVGDGYVAVPVEPTPEMLDAAVYAQEPNMGANRGGSNNVNRLRRRASRIYESMLQASTKGAQP